MRHFKLHLQVLLALACALGSASNSSAQTGTPSQSADAATEPVIVQVFVNSAMVVAAGKSPSKQYLLDGLQMLDAELSAGLPADERAALPIAQERMRRMADAIRARGTNAAEGLQLAMQYGIERLPAIVINGQSVIYGVTDVDQAVALWRQARASGQRPRN